LPENLNQLFDSNTKKHSLEANVKPNNAKKYFIVIRNEFPHAHKYETRKKGQHKDSIDSIFSINILKIKAMNILMNMIRKD